MSNLFIPLKSEFYDAFKRGEKTVEYRVYGSRWNEKTCPIGRGVTISKGYGKQNRLQGVVTGFRASREAADTDLFRSVYPNLKDPIAACIEIKVTP